MQKFSLCQCSEDVCNGEQGCGCKLAIGTLAKNRRADFLDRAQLFRVTFRPCSCSTALNEDHLR